MEEIKVSPNLTYEQHLIRVIASDVKRLRNKDVPLVKVQWSSNPKDCSWESREFIERTHPNLLSRAFCGKLLISNFFCVEYAFTVVTFCFPLKYCEYAISLRRGVYNNPHIL